MEERQAASREVRKRPTRPVYRGPIWSPLQRLGEPGGVLAAWPGGHGRLAAATSTHDFRHLTDQLASVQPLLDQVVRHHCQQIHLAVVDPTDQHHGAAPPRLPRRSTLVAATARPRPLPATSPIMTLARRRPPPPQPTVLSATPCKSCRRSLLELLLEFLDFVLHLLDAAG